MSQKFEGPQALLAGPFMLANGSGSRFSEYEQFDNNDAQVADTIAGNGDLQAVLVTEARNRISEQGRATLAVYYDGLTADERIVHGVYFIDETYRAGLPEIAIAALGAHALRVTPEAEVGYCETTPNTVDVKVRLAKYGYHVGDNETDNVLAFPSPASAEMPDHAADTA